jgi:hypothetical protein
MAKNVGTIDRTLRVLLGLVLLSLVVLLDTPARWWGLVGLVPLLTGLFSFCPLYSVLGISSCPVNSSR